MTGIKRTAGVRFNGSIVRLNGWAESLTPNCADKAGQSCPLWKAAWILGLEVYNNINNIYIFFMYISLRTREKTPSYSTPLVLSGLFDLVSFGYHNDVATAVAGKKVANV